MHPEAKSAYVQKMQEGMHLLYAMPWWLDAVTAQQWDVIRFHINGEECYLPFYKTTIRGLSTIANPPFTQWMPVLNTGNPVQVNDLYRGLPQVSILDVSFRPVDVSIEFAEHLSISSKYSYVIPFATTPKYNEGLRRNLAEAANKFFITSSDDIASFIKLSAESFRQRHMELPAWFSSVMPKVYESINARGAGIMEFAWVDKKPVAAILSGWDTHNTYYLAGGRISNEEGISAHALLLDHAIQRARGMGLGFDFEGSMIPGIANFFQSFGAMPTSFWRVRKFRGAGKLWALFH